MMNLTAYFGEADLSERPTEEQISSRVVKKHVDQKRQVQFVSETLPSGCILYTLLLPAIKGANGYIGTGKGRGGSTAAHPLV